MSRCRELGDCAVVLDDIDDMYGTTVALIAKSPEDAMEIKEYLNARLVGVKIFVDWHDSVNVEIEKRPEEVIKGKFHIFSKE